MYKFAAASKQESIVFGASRPGYSQQQVFAWIRFMQSQDIRRVCCLLSKNQLDRYNALLDIYNREFGTEKVCWSPIEDFCLCDLEALTRKILPFLIEADRQKQKVVVHCSGGIGRTGQILTAWLVCCRGFSKVAAITTTISLGRNPYEAAILATLKGQNPFRVIRELDRILNACCNL